MTDIFKIVEEIAKIEADKKAKIDSVKSEFKSHLKAYFAPMFEKHKGLNYFYIVGYTPSFNDGEPCTHSAYLEYEYEDDEDVYENKLSREDKCEIESHYDKIDLVIEAVYDTNYKIEFKRYLDDLNDFDIEIDEYYDCGF